MLGVEGAWLQSALEVASARKKFPIKKYAYAMADQASAGVSFISISSHMLKTIVSHENWVATYRVKELLKALGGEKVIISTAIPIIRVFLLQVWKAFTSPMDKKNLTIAVLNGLIGTPRWGSINQIAAAFLLFAESLPVGARGDFELAIQQWCQGHFISFPPQLP